MIVENSPSSISELTAKEKKALLIHTTHVLFPYLTKEEIASVIDEVACIYSLSLTSGNTKKEDWYLEPLFAELVGFKLKSR